MTTIIRDILQDLERTRENMLALSDDIWLSIDHNDPEAMRDGVAFKSEYNERMIAFDRLAKEISELVQQYTQVRMDESAPDIAEESEAERNARVVRELNREEAHGLDEDFTFKRPCGYALQGKAFNGLTTWRRLFDHVCRQLHERDPDLFQKLPDLPSFKTRRGNPFFAKDANALRVDSEVVPGIFAEINLSAKGLCGVIRLLLQTYGIPESEMTVYLREDRDAGTF